MATHWPEKTEIVGTKVQRLDGPEKSTGTAKYSFDINRPGLLQGMILRTPHAHCKVKRIDTSAAEKVPGFKAVHLIAKEGEELYYAGAEVLAIAADTEEHCEDAIRAVKVEYEVLPHVVSEQEALKKDPETVEPVISRDRKTEKEVKHFCVQPPIEDQKGDIEKAFRESDATVEVEIGSPVIAHQCLESHGLVAEWNDDQSKLTVWCSTQATTGTAGALAGHFGLKANDVECITHYMGGGFGSKFGPDTQGYAAAHLAKQAKAPVKLMLDRRAEAVMAGNRPSAFGTVKISGNRDGTLTGYYYKAYGTPGVAKGSILVNGPYVYTSIPNSKTEQTVVRLNAAEQRAMRAPRHPQSCLLIETAIDDLAAKLGIDPAVIRRKNHPKNDAEAAKEDPISLEALQGTIYDREMDLAMKLSDWEKKWHAPGADKGVVKHGIGMALHTWTGRASGQLNECTVIISADGSVLARTSTQDLGTAQRTVTAIVVAELLGLKPEDITVRLGESDFGRSSGSGGSTTCPSQAPAALQAVGTAKEELLAKIASRLGSEAKDLELKRGKVNDKAKGKSWSWKEACAKLGMDQISVTGSWNFIRSTQEKGISNAGVGGVQVAEVTVDTETGVVRLRKIVAVQDCGRIINKLACQSQVAGGVIMGLNYALFEERIMDNATGRMVNPNMEFYKLGGIEDMPEIVVEMVDMPERGVIGIGEPPTISTHAAIGNAIFNAIGARVSQTPFSPDRVLAALARKGGKS